MSYRISIRHSKEHLKNKHATSKILKESKMNDEILQASCYGLCLIFKFDTAY